MTLQKARYFANRLNTNGVEASVQEGYCGRGMFGKATAAVIINDNHDLDLALIKCPSLSKWRRDSLGLGAIFY